MDPERIRPTRKVAWCIKVPTRTAKMEIPDQEIGDLNVEMDWLKEKHQLVDH
jgi:hypothetical protein